MIHAIVGDLVQVGESEAILRCSHLEYRLAISAQTASALTNLSGEARRSVRLLTVLIHRDDSMQLIGFLDEAEREAFTQLQTVSGIGVKQALRILSGISVRNLIRALDAGDVKTLTTIPGIGQKTGQKMILALRNVLILDEDHEPRGRSAAHPYGDIIRALVDMGYDRKQVETLIDEQLIAQKEVFDSLSQHEIEEQLFRVAIKLLG